LKFEKKKIIVMLKFIDDEADRSDDEDRVERPNLKFDLLMRKPRTKLLDLDQLLEKVEYASY